MTIREDAEIRCIELVNEPRSHAEFSNTVKFVIEEEGEEALQKLIDELSKGEDLSISPLCANNTVFKKVYSVSKRCEPCVGKRKLYKGTDAVIYRNLVLGMCLDYVWDRPKAANRDVPWGHSAEKAVKEVCEELRKLASETNVLVQSKSVIFGLPEVQPIPANTGELIKFKPIQKETIMIKIENKTFFNGADISAYSDDALFGKIQEAEKELERLEAIKNKPKKLEKKIADLKEGIKALVEAVDARA